MVAGERAEMAGGAVLLFGIGVGTGEPTRPHVARVGGGATTAVRAPVGGQMHQARTQIRGIVQALFLHLPPPCFLKKILAHGDNRNENNPNHSWNQPGVMAVVPFFRSNFSLLRVDLSARASYA